MLDDDYIEYDPLAWESYAMEVDDWGGIHKLHRRLNDVFFHAFVEAREPTSNEINEFFEDILGVRDIHTMLCNDPRMINAHTVDETYTRMIIAKENILPHYQNVTSKLVNRFWDVITVSAGLSMSAMVRLPLQNAVPPEIWGLIHKQLLSTLRDPEDETFHFIHRMRKTKIEKEHRATLRMYPSGYDWTAYRVRLPFIYADLSDCTEFAEKMSYDTALTLSDAQGLSKACTKESDDYSVTDSYEVFQFFPFYSVYCTVYEVNESLWLDCWSSSGSSILEP